MMINERGMRYIWRSISNEMRFFADKQTKKKYRIR